MYVVKFKSVGNPDHGQFAPISDPETVHVKTLQGAVAAWEKYKDFWNLGGGNMPPDCGVIRHAKTMRIVARVSYNGRLWNPDGSAMPADASVPA